MRNPLEKSQFVDWIDIKDEHESKDTGEVLGWNFNMTVGKWAVVKKIEIQFRPKKKCGVSSQRSSFCVVPMKESDNFMDVGIIFIDSFKINFFLCLYYIEKITMLNVVFIIG